MPAKMGEYMMNSVLVTAMALAILLVVALPAAYCLSRFKFKGSKFFNVAFMADCSSTSTTSWYPYSSCSVTGMCG